MKNLLLIMVLIGIAAGNGCKKDKSNSNVTTTAAPDMTATIGDSTFSAFGVAQAYETTSSSGGINYIYLFGTTSYGKTIKIVLINNAGVGTAAIGAGNAAAYYYPAGTSGIYTTAVTGSVTLTAVSPDLVGTFNFTCADSTKVTNGVFSITAL